MNKLLLLCLLICGCCIKASDAKNHNVQAFKTPEIVGEIQGHNVYHYEIYAKMGDGYVTHHVYYVGGLNTVTSIHSTKPTHTNIMIDGVPYLPVQAEITK